MGTWGTGPFDNDQAGDFEDLLSGTDPSEREVLLRRTLSRPSADTIGDWEEAVAAAAVIAEQCPGGQRFSAPWRPPWYRPTPPLPLDLRPLAAAALVRIYNSETLAGSWSSTRLRDEWRINLARLHEALTEHSDQPQRQRGAHLGIPPQQAQPATSASGPRRR
ncbi:DUF4259 domain-containing protein [Streptomyces sp. NPDC026589]|uniref:DUF4259 domain-containing protein n=1 Tax=Streptomyces sp. NPDC026589 TaxID=3155609 RepID=UPI0033D881F2